MKRLKIKTHICLLQDGESTWLEGVLLLAAYLIIAASFYYYN